MTTKQRAKIRRRLAERDGLICHWCHRPLTLTTATIEHLRNRSDGGSNALQNLRLACAPCNNEREHRAK